MAPRKQSKLKMRANLKKFTFLARLIKKCKLKIPAKKLKIKEIQPSKMRTGLFKKR